MHHITTRAAPAGRSPSHARATSPVSIKSADVLEDGTFTGYGSVFNVIDSARDVVAPGAFAESLKVKTPKLLWQHDTTQIVGVWEEAREDSRGLWLKGRIIAETEKGRAALALLRAGALDGLSIGFETTACEWGSPADYETKYGCAPMGHWGGGSTDQIRILTGIDLWEVSLVTFPCCDPARVDHVKQAPPARPLDPLLAAAVARRNHAIARLAAAAA